MCATIPPGTIMYCFVLRRAGRADLCDRSGSGRANLRDGPPGSIMCCFVLRRPPRDQLCKWGSTFEQGFRQREHFM